MKNTTIRFYRNYGYVADGSSRMQIRCKDALYTYDVFHIVKAFFPNEEILQCVNKEQEPLVRLETEGGSCFSVSYEEIEKYTEKAQKKSYVNKKIYKYLEELTGNSLPWGILTGIRPTKLVLGKLTAGWMDREISDWFQENYFASEEKTKLSLQIAKKERSLLEQLDYREGYSLYIGIPFCPSICTYCSFSSSPLELWEDRVDAYLDALCKEIRFVGKVSEKKKLNTIYIGGGTPTTLEPEQLERLLCTLEESFSYRYMLEMTVEAGRPDSITEEKLVVLKRHHVTRISINPQTMQQKTLDEIGRRHSVQDVAAIYKLARDLGFDNINMDLIAGLPGETIADMEDTLEQIARLAPDSLTVHALAIKRAAKYGQEQKRIDSAEALEQMIHLGGQYAERMGLEPYYLYRQKNIAGNFENVGYAKVDKAGIYNILIMEEKQSIVAVGAGASTKIVFSEKKELENGRLTNIIRIENVKDITEYISRIDEMITRKEEWLWH